MFLRLWASHGFVLPIKHAHLLRGLTIASGYRTEWIFSGLVQSVALGIITFLTYKPVQVKS